MAGRREPLTQFAGTCELATTAAVGKQPHSGDLGRP